MKVAPCDDTTNECGGDGAPKTRASLLVFEVLIRSIDDGNELPNFPRAITIRRYKVFGSSVVKSISDSIEATSLSSFITVSYIVMLSTFPYCTRKSWNPICALSVSFSKGVQLNEMLLFVTLVAWKFSTGPGMLPVPSSKH